MLPLHGFLLSRKTSSGESNKYIRSVYNYLLPITRYIFTNSIIKNLGLRGRSYDGANGAKVVSLHDMFDVFKKVKGTPKYWQQARNELVAKIKQLGPFHIFYTFSCGEIRWPEIYLTLLREKGYKVEYPEDFDGHDEDLLVEGKPLWKYVNEVMSQRKHELFEESNFLLTRMFDERVKSFIKEIILANGQNQVKLRWYSYRVEFQARGMPHIHGVAWICEEYLKNELGIEGPLCHKKNHKAVAKLADRIIACQLPQEEPEKGKKNTESGDKNYRHPTLKAIVNDVQIHRHTPSCLKYNGTCRYHFPRLPCRETVVARPIDELIELKVLPKMDKEERKNFIEKAKTTLEKAKKELEIIDEKAKKKLDKVDSGAGEESMSFKDFCAKIKTDPEDYMKYLQITEKGTVLKMKRNVKDRNVNNFSPEMLYAWNANMDIQLALDPYAVITYIVNYVNKDETGMTKFMTEALREKANEDTNEKLKALKLAYFTHRQVGSSEAVYRILPGMRLKDSNISCIFVPSGFPENRSDFYRRVKEEDIEEVEDSNEVIEEEEGENDDGDDPDPSAVREEDQDKQVFDGQIIVEIEGREGKFKKSINMIDRYAARPEYLEEICLAQFATSYTHMGKLPKKAVMNNDPGNVAEFGCSTLKSTYQKIFGSNVFLPRYIALENGLGLMRLRTYPSVLRIHNSQKKEGHEQYYADLLLFSSWRDEEEFHRDEPDLCSKKFNIKIDQINANRRTIYPGEPVIDMMDTAELEMLRPIHLTDTLDCQGAQANDDDLEEGCIEDPLFETFGYTGNLNLKKEKKTKQFENCKYKKIPLPDDGDLRKMIRNLVPEQMNVLRAVLPGCKDIVKARNNIHVKPRQHLLIVHGGAGNITYKLLLVQFCLMKNYF